MTRRGSARSGVLPAAALVGLGALAAFAAAGLGCRAVLGLGDYQRGADDGAIEGGGDGASDVAACVGEGGCWSCEASSVEQLASACVGCTPFDPSRSAAIRVDGGLVPLPDAAADASTASGDVGADASGDAPADADAGSLPPCAGSDATVYVVGSTAFKPLLAPLAAALAKASPPLTVIYQGQGSCVGVDVALNGTPIGGAASRWSALDGSEERCALADGTVAQVGVSDVFATSCPGVAALPTTVGDFFGPIQAMTFAVPAGSPEHSIDALAAYATFGLASPKVAPWSDETQIFVRSALSGTQQMIAAAIGVDAARWRGVPESTSQTLLAALSKADPAVAIGILSADVADDNPSAVRPLAYQHFGQSCGYTPDEVPGSGDKRNVREGRYAIWGPLHVLTRIGAGGYPIDAGARALVGYFGGTLTPPGGVDLIALAAQKHVVPPCAMRVTRTSELGPVSLYAPERACGCAFDAAVAGHPTCAPCTNDVDCKSASLRCSYGYCESR